MQGQSAVGAVLPELYHPEARWRGFHPLDDRSIAPIPTRTPIVGIVGGSARRHAHG